jgi:Na+/pantothenate symporter
MQLGMCLGTAVLGLLFLALGALGTLCWFLVPYTARR